MALTLALWGAVSAMAWGAPLTADELNVLREHDPALKGTFPSQAARELARKIGREGNVDGLRGLIKLGNLLLFGDAVGSFAVDPTKHLPKELEALLLEYYGDRSWGRYLLAVLARDFDKREAVPKYRTRQLFDLLYTDLKRPSSDQQFYARRITATDLAGIEPELIALLPALPSSSASELVRFLGTRRFAPAVPALVTLQADTPDRRSTVSPGLINWALLQIGTPQAKQAVLDRLRILAKGPASDQAGWEIASVLWDVRELPVDRAPDYAELRAALPEELIPVAWSNLVKLIVSRREMRGVPDLILALSRGLQTDEAINALLAIGEPTDWRVARAELERRPGNMSPSHLASLQKRLGDALADEAGFLAQRRQNERQQELEQGRVQFNERKHQLTAIRGTEPKRYAMQLGALIERRESQLHKHADAPLSKNEKLELASEYVALAAFLRFKLGQSDKAIAAYEAAGRLRSAAGEFNNAPLAVADIQRFDRRDPKKAIEQYRLAITEINRVSNRPPHGWPWAGLRRLIEREITFLESGRTFSGTISIEDLAVVQVWVLFSPMLQVGMDPALNEAVKRIRGAAARGERLSPEASGLTLALDALPASQFQIANALMAVLQLPAQDMLRFYAKHDPAGYLTAVFLAMVINSNRRDLRSGLLGLEIGPSGPSDSVKSAAEDFFRARNIRVSLGPDLR